MFAIFRVRLAGISSQPGINAGTGTITGARRANEESIVILLHHAQQDLSVMIWYVHLLATELKRPMPFACCAPLVNIQFQEYILTLFLVI